MEVALQSDAEIIGKSGEDVTLSVSLTLERKDSETVQNVIQFKPPKFPSVKEVAWWVVVGNAVDRTILAIKRVTLPTSSSNRQVELDFACPDVSHETSFSLKVYVLCDSFMGCDQEIDFSLLIQV